MRRHNLASRAVRLLQKGMKQPGLADSGFTFKENRLAAAAARKPPLLFK